MVLNTNQSYTELFPKEKLIYLSKDSKKLMTHYDPEKVYIIGSLIDTADPLDKFASYSQAKIDNIECLRLPLDQYIKYNTNIKFF